MNLNFLNSSQTRLLIDHQGLLRAVNRSIIKTPEGRESYCRERLGRKRVEASWENAVKEAHNCASPPSRDSADDAL